jgi:type IV pilus assembly protein PilX
MSFRPKPSHPALRFKRQGQQGVALWTVVVLALLLGLLALSQTNSVVGQFRTSRNERDLALARQAAEAALRDAEADITCQVWDTATGQLIQTTDATEPLVNSYCLSLAPTCSAMMPTQDEPGMRLLGRTPAARPAEIDWNTNPCTTGNCAVTLGTKTRATAVAGVIALPRYHIDVLDAQLATTYEPSPLFRITARGYGATLATVVDLQEVYRPCK